MASTVTNFPGTSQATHPEDRTPHGSPATSTRPVFPPASEQDETMPVTYSVTDAEIAKIRERCATLSITAPNGYEEVRVAIGQLRETRVAVEKRRVELKADALAWGRKVDTEAKRITGLLEAIEEPLRAQKQAVDEEKARAKAEAETAKLRAMEEQLRAEREAEEAERRAAREAEEVRLRAEREAEEARLAEDRKRLEAERAALVEAQRVADEKLAAERAALAEERRKADAAAAADRAELERQRQAVEAERQKAERAEFERQAQIRAEREAAERLEREQLEAARRAAELAALQPDIEKVRAFVAAVHALPRPKLKSKKVAALLAVASDAIDNRASALEAEVTK